MASAYERQVLLFHVKSASAPKGAPPVVMKDIAEIIQAEWKAGRAITRLEELEAENLDQDTLENAKKRPNNAVFIQDMKMHTDCCEILLTLGDAAESDPTIVDLVSRDLQQFSKGTNGGVGFSAHVCIAFKGSAPPTQYRATLERMSNMGRNTVVTYLNRLLRNHARNNPKFRYVEGATDRDLAFRPRLESAAKPSRALSTAIKTGRFSEVVVVQRKKIADELDQAAGFRLIEKRLKVDLEDVPPNDAGRLDWLNKLRLKAKQRGYDEVQVKLKPFAGGSDMSARFSTEVADAADAVFSRHEQIDFDVETGQCHKKIVPRIGDRLTAMLKKDALWR